MEHSVIVVVVVIMEIVVGEGCSLHLNFSLLGHRKFCVCQKSFCQKHKIWSLGATIKILTTHMLLCFSENCNFLTLHFLRTTAC